MGYGGGLVIWFQDMRSMVDLEEFFFFNLFIFIVNNSLIKQSGATKVH